MKAKSFVNRAILPVNHSRLSPDAEISLLSVHTNKPRKPIPRSTKPLKRSPIKKRRKNVRVNGAWMMISGRWYFDNASPDGQRFVASPAGWAEITNQMREAFCERCLLKVSIPQIGIEWHHIYGRGMGGSKQEDRLEVKGIRMREWLCRKHHDGTPIKRRDWPILN